MAGGEEFWAAVRAGVDPAAAARLVGVSARTGRRWVADRGGVIPQRSRAGRAGCDYVRLSGEERETLALMRAAGRGDAEIAAALGRHRSTIWRERTRNRGRDGGYRPAAAQRRADARARARHRRPAKLAVDGPLRDYVVAGLLARWSPEEIAHRTRMDHPDDPLMRVCAETIYQALFVQARGALRRDLTEQLRSQRRSRQPRGRRRTSEQQRRGKLVATVSIRERPAEADDRAVPGHWEGDLLLGRGNASAIGTLVERSTRFVMLVHLPRRRTAAEFAAAITPVIGALPAELRRSLTWDHGKEMALHRQISLAADLAIYFADPGKPWMRGSNEQTNGLLRQYFPKGVSLRQFGPDHLAAVAAELNGRPRKTLGWRTPAEALNDILGRPFQPPVLR
jgi:transposase, IS30 family